MLLPSPASGAYSSCSTVGQQLSQGSRVLVSDNAGDRPTHRRVSGRERVSSNKKASGARTRERTLASGRVFEDFGIGERANGSLPGQNSGLAFLIVTLQMPQQEQSGPGGR